MRRLMFIVCVLLAIACWGRLLVGGMAPRSARLDLWGAGYVSVCAAPDGWVLAFATPSASRTGISRGGVTYNFLTGHSAQTFTGGSFTRPQDWPITQGLRFDRYGLALWLATIPNVLKHEFNGAAGSFEYGQPAGGASVSLTVLRLSPWWPALLSSLPHLVAFIRGPVRRWRRRRRGRCQKCGYDLTGNLSGGCPECGFTLRRPAEH